MFLQFCARYPEWKLSFIAKNVRYDVRYYSKNKNDRTGRPHSVTLKVIHGSIKAIWLKLNTKSKGKWMYKLEKNIQF